MKHPKAGMKMSKPKTAKSGKKMVKTKKKKKLGKTGGY
tara:strand:- start:83 stop:196 length:114 start_codon:yes stop_codon:yes gene_type:complete